MARALDRLAGKPPLFRASLEMQQHVPHRVWTVLRWLSVLASFGLAALGLVDPSLALKLFWALYVPVLPVVFLVAPAIWRNICPMAALNQIPRTLGFTRGLTVPPRVQQYAPLISAGIFLFLIGMRRVFLDHNGIGLAVFLVTVLSLAFIGGVAFKGKSGWCSQFCPMLQIERFYGQAPLQVVRNDHCRPCVGCTKNCYDFNPTAAYLADLYDENPQLGLNRKAFAGAFPWIIYAFFTQPYLANITLGGALEIYGRILLFAAAGVGTFLTIEAISKVSASTLTQLHVVAAINVFYHYVAPLALGLWGAHGAVLPDVIQAAVAILSLVWLVRALPRENRFRASVLGAPARVADSVLKAATAAAADKAEVQFISGPTVLATPGESLLSIAEGNGVKIESGCRMGMCGADPVRILAGEGNLSPCGGTEKATLERLDAGESCRMACMAKVTGPVTVLATVDPAAIPAVFTQGGAGADAAPAGPGVEINPEVRRVIVVGNGVAGTTAATEVRKLHPHATVTLFGLESYDFYNRMAIGNLVSEKSGISNLYLLGRDWHTSKNVQYFPDRRVIAIDPADHLVTTEDGEALPFDRLLLATGSRSFVPPLEGFGTPGSFVLRTIDDAIQIQQHVRRHHARTAVIVGGGLLGLEAAHDLSEVGVRCYVLNRAAWPLDRQLDATGGALLAQMMADLGITVLGQTSAARILGEDRITGVELTDGKTLAVDLCLITAGIQPIVDLAVAGGLEVERGVVVDDRMQTSHPDIYAAGDCAALGGRTFGLWPAGMEQGKVAAVNLVGGESHYVPTVPPARLKVAGIDLLSVGRIDVPEGGSEIVIREPTGRSYRKLVLGDDGRLLGAIVIGFPELFDVVSDAVKASVDVAPYRGQLVAGDWSLLEAAGALVLV
jgi:NADPH-dependent 2,4-dienoyl-CoA reductase/sulfur reductase-like enzyme/ferredoxin